MRDIGSWFGLTRRDGEQQTALILGCPVDDAATGRSGASAGPVAIRRWGESAEAIDETGRLITGLQVRDLGDVMPDAPAWPTIEAAARQALRQEPNGLLIGLGGDHSVTPPLVAAVADRYSDLAFLMLDAHADCFDTYDGDRNSHACVVRRVWDTVGVEPDSTCLVGLRSFAHAELESIDDAGLVVTAAAWTAAGSEELARQIAESVGDRPLYVSLDIDVLDPAVAPGTGYPIAGGPDCRALLDLLASLWGMRRVVGMDLVEVAPALDPSDSTAAVAAHILLQVLAHISRRGAERAE